MQILLKKIKINPKIFSLRTKMAILSFGSVFLAILTGGFIVVGKISVTLEKELGMRAMAIARTLAQSEEIQKNVGTPGGTAVIQPIAERTRLATGVDYIVVLDMDRIRYSHPVEERLGKRFDDADLGPALANNEYISRAEGVMGPSVRAFVPLKVEEGTRQVGVVVVGVLTPTIGSLLRTIQLELYYSLCTGLLVGLLGSVYLAKKIKNAMFSMEPAEIARLLEERQAAFQAMEEGIIAIDNNCRITIANDQARRIIGRASENIVGKPIKEVIPNTRLPEVLETGQPQINEEMFINNIVVLTKRVPIKFKGEIIGAVSTFQDKTEVNKLAEELTGVKSFVEALRVQNHEYMNKLHTIAGLIQLGKQHEALDYIFHLTEEQQEITGFLSKNIFDNDIAGLLLGKYLRAKELRTELIIDRNTKLKGLPKYLDTGDLVVIIGNLIENAFDVVRNEIPERRKVFFSMVDGSESLIIKVRDLGKGIEAEKKERIFEQGYTTKGPKNLGIGLYLVKRYVDLAGGTISVKCPEDGGAEFFILIPKEDSHI